MFDDDPFEVVRVRDLSPGETIKLQGKDYIVQLGEDDRFTLKPTGDGRSSHITLGKKSLMKVERYRKDYKL